MSKFTIGDTVTSVINPHFLGQVVAITHRATGDYYAVSYFKDGEPITATMDGFELKPTIENGSVGFQIQIPQPE